MTLCEEQVEASADNVKGEETSVSLTGELTVTPANAGRERASAPKPASTAIREECISAGSFAVEIKLVPTRCALVLQR